MLGSAARGTGAHYIYVHLNQEKKDSDNGHAKKTWKCNYSLFCSVCLSLGGFQGVFPGILVL